MNTDIGTIYKNISPDERRELAPLLNKMGDRYLHTENGISEIRANPVIVKSKEQEIFEMKQYLTSTDYCVIKCMETGESMAILYPEVHAKRTEARQRINELEALIAAESTSEES